MCMPLVKIRDCQSARALALCLTSTRSHVYSTACAINIRPRCGRIRESSILTGFFNLLGIKSPPYQIKLADNYESKPDHIIKRK